MELADIQNMERGVMDELIMSLGRLTESKFFLFFPFFFFHEYQIVFLSAVDTVDLELEI